MTPMTSLPFVSFTDGAAPPVVPLLPPHAAAPSRPASGSARIRPIRMSVSFFRVLDPEVLEERGLSSLHLVVPERGDDLSLAEQIVAGGPRRGDREGGPGRAPPAHPPT